MKSLSFIHSRDDDYDDERERERERERESVEELNVRLDLFERIFTTTTTTFNQLPCFRIFFFIEL
jgi:hypothetical protein